MGEANYLLAGIVIGFLIASALFLGVFPRIGLPANTVTETNTEALAPNTITSTFSVTSTLYPLPPPYVVVYGTVGTSSLGTYATKLSIENGNGQVIKNFTLSGSNAYNATLPNGALYYFHVYWNTTPTGGGDKNCATVFLNVGYGTKSIRLDLSC